MRLIEVIADEGSADTILGIAAQQQVSDYWPGPDIGDGRRSVRLLVRPEQMQPVLDALQGALGAAERTRIVVLPVEATLPRPAELEKDEARESARRTTSSREELYNSIERNARLDRNFLILVLLSTVVATIGLIEDNVAVVIGAMVIAPLLGPNLALALGAALGDTPLMLRALKTNIGGVLITLVLSLTIGLIWPVNIASRELLARTDVGLDSVALALASGAAAVLSITTGLPSVLVGVMVAVALMPPAATLGLMLGTAQFQMAIGAGLLLAVNIVSVNLAAKLVFLVQGVRPRTWFEKQKAQQSLLAYIAFWVVSLLVLIAAIYLRH